MAITLINRLILVSDAAIAAAMARCPGRKGTAALRALLSDRYEQGYSRSGAERRLRRLVKAAGLDAPAFNAEVLGFEVDAVWPAEKLIVEVDGCGAHGHQAAFERDRKRDQRLAAAGYVVLRFTWAPAHPGAAGGGRPNRRDAECAKTHNRAVPEAVGSGHPGGAEECE